MRASEVDLPVTDPAGAATLSQRVLVCHPDSDVPPHAVLLCLPGASFCRHYWHLVVAGNPGYSFAEHFTELGYVVAAVDHLGVGDSSDPAAGNQTAVETLARADAEVACAIWSRVVSYSGRDIPLVGVGHSMGAGIAIAAQAICTPFDALVLLGYAVDAYTNAPETVAARIAAPDGQCDVATAVARNYDLICGALGPDVSRPWVIPRELLTSLLYADDVPAGVIAADRAHQSRIPALANAEIMTPGFIQPYLEAIRTPVFLGFGGQRDLAPDPLDQARFYPRAAGVTVEVLDGSAHAHNYAGHRVQLWNAIGDWLTDIGTRNI